MPSELTWTVLAVCVVAAFLAGFVDAVAGGGGLIQLPVLLAVLPTAPLATVSGTNKSVSVVGTTGAAVSYARRVDMDRRTVLTMAGAAFLGSAGGAALVTTVDRDAFEPVILVLLIAVTVFTLVRPDFGKIPRSRHGGLSRAAVLGGGIGFYDGIIGPGTGMFLVLGLIAMLGATFLTASAAAKSVNVATNLAALAIFIPGGHVLWPLALTMAPANLLGGLLGARTAMNRGSAFVRVVFLGMIVLLITRLASNLAR
jgi:uncharacterized membrane protein YfcA